MPKQSKSSGKNGKTSFVIGRASFRRISAVEGIQLQPAMEKRAAEANSKGLSAEEHRKLIVRAYREA